MIEKPNNIFEIKYSRVGISDVPVNGGENNFYLYVNGYFDDGINFNVNKIEFQDVGSSSNDIEVNSDSIIINSKNEPDVIGRVSGKVLVTGSVVNIQDIEYPLVINGDSFSLPSLSSLEDGEYGASILLKFDDGTILEESISIIVDSTPLNFAPTFLVQKEFYNKPVSVNLDVKNELSGIDLDKSYYTINGTQFKLDGFGVLSINNPVQGLNHVSVHLYDKAGNLSIEEFSFKYDSIAPILKDYSFNQIGNDFGVLSLTFEKDVSGLSYSNSSIPIEGYFPITIELNKNFYVEGDTVVVHLAKTIGNNFTFDSKDNAENKTTVNLTGLFSDTVSKIYSREIQFVNEKEVLWA